MPSVERRPVGDFLDSPTAQQEARQLPVSLCIGTVFAAEQPISPDDALFLRQRKEIIDMVLATLPPRDQAVLLMRFGFDGHDPMLLKEIAQRFGVIPERVRQIEARALRRLRHPTRSWRLNGIWERHIGDHLCQSGKWQR